MICLDSHSFTVYFPLMAVYFEPMDVYFVKTVFLQGPYFNYFGPFILQYNCHGHIFLIFVNSLEFYIFLDFQVHATFTQKLRVHATSMTVV